MKHSGPRSVMRPNEPKTPWGVARGESRGANRERARYGCTEIKQVAEVGRTHHASCESKALA